MIEYFQVFGEQRSICLPLLAGGGGVLTVQNKKFSVCFLEGLILLASVKFLSAFFVTGYDSASCKYKVGFFNKTKFIYLNSFFYFRI